ncbi:HU family DNA-binding protein [Anabaena sp. UHCC 0187]|uniref:HU family DNA-binding protein n=1 Tax=Anabaena sp. UHCC 0187 TaxID=2590018 RepID=UPI0014464CBF|nr:HU family DNA-binding protein [Anabaena sp. UHCC 0187]MTJ14757.1 HU family DNA-binding protein [Anabaena sp. UHCC 0187]
MNANLTEYLQQSTGYTEPTVTSVIESFCKFIQVSLRNGEEVRINKFGVFSFKDLPDREGRNPRTGEKIDVEATRRPTFKFSKSFSVEPDPATLPIIEAIKHNSPPIPPIPTELLTQSNRNWFMNIGDQPVEIPESELISKGLTKTTPLWSEETGWKRASEIAELGYLFQKVA